MIFLKKNDVSWKHKNACKVHGESSARNSEPEKFEIRSKVPRLRNWKMLFISV